jgi:aminoglycoside phosphotransferase (APT) family kinase protein
VSLEECLPEEYRGPATTITRIAVGLSGASVHRVETAGRAFVLKVAGDGEDAGDWARAVHIQRLAADAGLAPAVVHVDEQRRAVLSAFVVDRSFPAFFHDPTTRDQAITLLGRTVRRLHALAVPADTRAPDPRAFLSQTWRGLPETFRRPDFAHEAVRRVLDEAPPPAERAAVLSHNDLNPTNLVWDGQSLLVLDWATAGVLDPYYDLAVLAVFLRMDEGTCLRLLSAYDGQEVSRLPAPFVYYRRLSAALVGTMQLHVAQKMTHAGATGTETLATTLSLADLYQRMRAGEIKMGTPAGQWAFGLTMMKLSLAL